MLNAFWRVAPSVRFNRRAIDRAGIFLRASDLSSRTWTDVQGRLFAAFRAMYDLQVYKSGALITRSDLKRKYQMRAVFLCERVSVERTSFFVRAKSFSPASFAKRSALSRSVLSGTAQATT